MKRALLVIFGLSCAINAVVAFGNIAVAGSLDHSSLAISLLSLILFNQFRGED